MLIDLTEKEKKILWFIVKNPGSSQKKISDELKFLPSTISCFLKKAESLMLIVRYKRKMKNIIHPTTRTIELFKILFKEDYLKFKEIEKWKKF
ncbi:hypothetical protein [Cetobacterium sp.]|uniref:hypothetical protein n=1 Tax=Cetobacterium sp. TaxID=2071632 RepID=UPI003F3C5A43